MKILIKNIEKSLLAVNNHINNKEQGVNYLEKIKYLLIDKIKEMDLEIINKDEMLDSKNEIINFGENKLILSLETHQEAITKIKSNVQNDFLCIVLKGFASIDIYENLNIKEFQSINLFSKTGVVLTKNTMITKSISKDSILLYIINDNDRSIVIKEN